MNPPMPSLLLPERPLRKWRWFLPAAAALALHLLLLLALDHGVGLPGFAKPADDLHALPPSPTQVSLAPAKAAAKINAAGAAPKPATTPRKPRTDSTPALPVAASDDMAPPAEILDSPLNAPSSAPVPVAATVPLAPADVVPEPAVVAADAITYRFSMPPPVTLKYDVQHANADGQNTYGHGTISWQVNGERYVIEGDAGILFISALRFGSEGTLDSQGIAPERYREKRFRKAETNTHFNRERALISFSASEINYPRNGGEQDRASVIWQLAGIGRGDSEKITVGAEIPLFVAGVRDADIWTMRVIAEETIDTGAGKIRSWHFLRKPRAGSFEQTIDLWLAPELDWYPVRLRQTDANGAWLDMTMTGMRRAANQ